MDRVLLVPRHESEYATVGTVAPYPVELQLSGRRVEIDTFVDLQKMLGVDDPVRGP